MLRFSTWDKYLVISYPVFLDLKNQAVFPRKAFDSFDNYSSHLSHHNIFYDLFEYDTLGRKTKYTDPDSGESSFNYDANGNLVSEVSGGGNLQKDDTYYYEYNDFNQLSFVKLNNSSGTLVESYLYDPDGTRVLIINHIDNSKIYTPFKEFMMIVNSTGTYNFTYVYQNDVLVARINPDNSIWYYHPDHLGSTTLITDASANIVEQVDYYPFGGVIGSSKEKRGYEGKELDSTGLNYFGARYYDPEIRIFLQIDPSVDWYDPQSLNPYSFEKWNPYKYIDPDGKWAITYEVGLTGGVATSGGTITKGIFVIVDDETNKISQIGSTNTGSGGANFKLGLGGNLLIGGSVNDKINHYTDFDSTTTQSLGARAGFYTTGLEYNREFTDLESSGYSIYYAPGFGVDAHSEFGTNFGTNLWWESKESIESRYSTQSSCSTNDNAEIDSKKENTFIVYEYNHEEEEQK